MKMRVEKEACIGCGSCQAIASDVFEITEDGLAEVKIETIPAELIDDAKDALEACPTGAIVEVTEEKK